MTTTPPEDPHILLGAYILGGLSNEERREFSRHIDGCEYCRAEAARFSGIPSILEKARPGLESTVDVEPTSTVVDLLAARRRAVRRSAWRIGLAATGLVAASLAVGIAVAPTFTPREAGLTVVAASESGTAGPAATMNLVATAWGTQLDVKCSNMPTSGVLTLWVIDENGKSTQLASWSGTEDGSATLAAASWITVPNMKRLEVRQGDAPIAEAAVES